MILARRLPVVVSLMMMATTVLAQRPTVQGKVTGADGRPISAAGIRAIKSRAVTRSDVNGAFEIAVDTNDSLMVSRIGFRTAVVSASATEIVLAAVSLDLAPLNVTGSRRSGGSLDMAGASVVVDSGDIRRSSAANIASLLENSSGIQPGFGVPSGQSVMIRGLGDERVLVLVDGEPVEGTSLRSFDLTRQSVANVDRVEVIKGPMSALYGSDALGGVINIISSRPSKGDHTLKFATATGTNGRVELSGAGSMAARSTVVRLDGSWRHEGETPGVPSTDGAFAREGALGVQLTHEFSNLVHIEGGVDGSVERQRWLSQSEPVRYYAFNDNVGGSSRLMVSGVVGAWSASTHLFASDFVHNYSLSTYTQPIAGAGDPAQREAVARWSMDADRSAAAHHLGVGLQLDGERLAAPQKVQGDRVTERNAAFYLSDDWTAGAWTLSGAVRRTQSANWGGMWTPQLGAVWHLGASAIARTSFAQGFRAPSFKERGYTFVNFAAGYEIRGDSALRPEQSRSLGAGGSWFPARMMGALRFDLDLYRNDLGNLIDYRQVGTTPTGLLIYTPVNVQRARTEGVEFAAIGHLERWMSRLSWALMDARDLTDGVPLSLRARNSGSWLLERSGAARSTISLSVSFTGPAAQTSVDPTTGVGSMSGKRASFTTVDFKVQRRLASLVEMNVGVTNLLDARPAGWAAPLNRAAIFGISWGRS